MESDLIDYTPAIKDSALKLAKRCRMGPYFIPASPADGKGATGPTQYSCSWYAPGASGGVNIDGGTAADPETGMIYVGGQTGLGTIVVQKKIPAPSIGTVSRTIAAACPAQRLRQPDMCSEPADAVPVTRPWRSSTGRGLR